MKKLRVGINGFGRIGRVLCRVGFDRLEIAGINDLGDCRTAAHLLKYDSAHGVFNRRVEFKEKSVSVDGQLIPFSAEKDPAKIPWKDWGVDVVLECTGAFKNRSDFDKHLEAGAKKVFISAPAPVADLTLVYGINHEQYDSEQHHVISNASCTTNCLAPLAQVIHQNFGIVKGMMTTIHSYTNDQRVLDAPHSDLRRARAAAVSMIPTTTGAAKAVGLVLPELKGKIDGVAVRVPTPNVSLVDLVAETTKPVTREAVNEVLTRASQNELKGVLAVECEPLVSIDYNGHPASSIVDLENTMVVGDHMVKVFSWYDNEMGFSNRMVDFCHFMNSRGL